MIKGQLLRDAIISGANHIANYRSEVDALNVFPVPDGDTGTNMSMTIAAAKKELAKLPDTATVSEVSTVAASALLRGARGNSGVILSLLFRGFSIGLQGKTTATAGDLAHALGMGVEAAYKAVMKPTEGTILTVSRVAAQTAIESAPSVGDNIAMLWDILMKAGEETLERTPEMLPVLKKAGVVDAGGKGFLVIFQGMAEVFHGRTMIEIEGKKTTEEREVQRPASGTITSFEELAKDVTFWYCTEFIIDKTDKEESSLPLRAYLESIGDSVVVVEDEEIIKAHVHTNDPGQALTAAVKHGGLSRIKIENMREQFESELRARGIEGEPEKKPTEAGELFPYQPVDPEQPYGFVAVAAGEGIEGLFCDLGVNHVVSGGQTMNPSTEDILKAIQATPAQQVFVLPNNKNIIMAAEQAVHLADRKVFVLHTKTIPQGLNAMIAFDPDLSADDNCIVMTESFEGVVTGQITFAARDSDFDGHKIKEGELLALEGGKLAFTHRDLIGSAVKLIGQMVKKKGNDSPFLTLIYGEDVTPEQAAEVERQVKQRYPNCEIALIAGMQPVYYFIMSID